MKAKEGYVAGTRRFGARFVGVVSFYDNGEVTGYWESHKVFDSIGEAATWAALQAKEAREAK